MLPAQDELVRGPEKCGQLGLSLIVEPTCSTHKKHQYPSQAVVVTNAARRIIELSKAGEKVKRIIVLGEEDPTRHPDFRDITQNLRELTNKWYPRAKLCLLSDDPQLETTDVVIALGNYDEPILRFEAGTQKTYKDLTGAKAGEFKTLVERLTKLELERLVLQACFVRGSVDNSTDSEVRAWLKYVGEIAPAAVQVYTLPKASKALKPVTKAKLEKIVAQVGEKTGIPCELLEV